MEAIAKVKHLRTTARKARLVVNEIRGLKVGAALSLLDFSIKKQVSRDVSKLIRSAVANLQSRNLEVSVDADNLYVKEIYVDEGPVMKRFRPRAQGRAGRILKKMCHISVTVSS